MTGHRGEIQGAMRESANRRPNDFHQLQYITDCWAENANPPPHIPQGETGAAGAVLVCGFAYACTACRSSVMVTSLPTNTPPASSATFHIKP
jgi:hypothetical protein